MKRGQYVRLLVGNGAGKFIAASKNLSITLTANLEESSTKDTTGDWVEYDLTVINYTINSTSVILTDDDELGYNGGNEQGFTLANALDAVEGGNALPWKIAEVNSENNRTIVSNMLNGNAFVTNVEATAQNRQDATYQMTLQGDGEITVS